MEKDEEVLTIRTGWGPFRLPGEKKRMKKAQEKAKRIWDNAKENTNESSY